MMGVDAYHNPYTTKSSAFTTRRTIFGVESTNTRRMSADLSERIGQLVIPATVQCTTPESSEGDLRMLTVYGAWTPDEDLEYAGTTTQELFVRARQHRCCLSLRSSSITHARSTSRRPASGF
eukprot:COSAG02_NODE_6360_length_3624_cov_2.571915_1_plen_122_part_00